VTLPGLREQKEHLKMNKPLRDRLSVVENAFAKASQQMDRLLELYLSGEFSKGRLSERRDKLERRTRRLKSERADLQQQLQEHTISDAQVATVTAAAQRMAEGLVVVDESFEARRKVIDHLDVKVTLRIEDGQKIIDAECWIGEATVPIASGSTCGRATYHRKDG
jgi:DNA repair exonuclease SbcCD ATPase subunit